MNLLDESYKSLISAIVDRALLDYKSAKKKLKKNPNDKEAKKLERDVKSFFTSDYFEVLTDLNGKDLIKGLERLI